MIYWAYDNASCAVKYIYYIYSLSAVTVSKAETVGTTDKISIKTIITFPIFTLKCF
jgi:hypothetical protein